MAVSPSGAGPDGDTLPHLDRCAAAYREEYGGNEYGGLPVIHCIVHLMNHHLVFVPTTTRPLVFACRPSYW
jgi:hypothetical protein